MTLAIPLYVTICYMCWSLLTVFIFKKKNQNKTEPDGIIFLKTINFGITSLEFCTITGTGFII